MRTVQASEITKNIREMCIEANHFLSDDMKKVFNESVEKEESPLGKQILNQLQENLEIAGRDMIPICQDTGMAVVFIKVGQEVHIEGGNLTDAINEGVRQGYVDGYLRKSVVRDPIDRMNTKDNTPAIIHYEIVDGDQVDITVAPKGFGSENMSRVFMLKPADGIEGVKEKILEAVRDAGPNACPPMVVGVGIGGTFEKCALMAKHALTRNLNEESPVPYVRDLEKEMLEKINGLGIGPGGLGGRDIPVIPDKRIQEINFGALEGHIMRTGNTMESNCEEFDLFFKDPLKFPRPENGENIQDVLDRTREFWLEKTSDPSLADKTILVSSHGCAVRALLQNLYKDPEHFWHGCVPPNCSINLVGVKDGKARFLEEDKVYA